MEKHDDMDPDHHRPSLGRGETSTEMSQLSRRGIGWLHRTRVYGLAVLFTLAVFLARMGMTVSFGSRPLLILYVFPVICSAYIGGLGPGMVSTILSSILVDYFLIPPTGSFLIENTHDLIQCAILIVNGVLISMFIEALHRARRTAERSELLQAVTLASIGDAVISTDNEGNITFFNAQAEHLTGWNREEAHGKALSSVLTIAGRTPYSHGEDWADRALDTEPTEGSRDAYSTVTTRDGRQIAVEESRSPIRQADGAIIGAVLVLHDCSERIASEEALRKSEERFSLAMEASKDGVWDWETKTGQVYFSPGYAFMLGYAPGELPANARFWMDHIHPEDRDRVIHANMECVEKGLNDFVVEYRMQARDGQWRWILSRGKAIERDGNGRAVRVVGTHTDITERKHAEEAIAEAKRQWEGTFDAISDWVSLIDEDQNIVRSNKSADKFCNASFDEIIGKRCHEIVHGLDRVIDDCPARRALKSKRREEMEFRTEDGRWLSVSAEPAGFSLNNRELLVHIVRDISKRKGAEEDRIRMEQRLQQAQKAESLSRMAGAIAHNFNNLLGGVIGNLELVQEEVCPGSFGETCIHEAMKASKRAATISRFMLTYVGQTSGKPELMDCANALRDACSLLSPSLPANVSFRAELPSLGPIIRVDEAQLTQILTHLMDNAVEAIGEKQGEINLHLDIVPGAQTGELNHCPLQWEAGSKDYACISISDTGGGIDPENLDKIFDPFFTTRFVGRGLGLPVSMGLLRALEGGISVENHPGQGVTFKVFLPILEQVNAPPLRTGASLSSHAPEGGLVLLVDDDLVSRTVAEAQLNRLGYEVVTASGGIEGVDKFRTCKDDFLFVLLDVYMLPMDGWETLAALRSIRPGIPAVFVSGHDEAQLNYEEHTERPQAFLHKPYRLEDLKSALRVVLKS